MPFSPGDFVHVASLGKGTVREVRNGGACLVEINGRLIVASADRLSPLTSSPKPPPRATAAVARTRDMDARAAGAPASLDLHGHTVDEAIEAVNAFLNASFLAGTAEVRIIHGRSGGKLKAALHSHLRRMPSLRAFALDPRNPGVTIVQL